MPQDFLPEASEIGPGFVLVSDTTPTIEQLATTFPDPRDAAIRLDAWEWRGQGTRRFVQGPVTVEVSVHEFLGPAGAELAMPWFAKQRAQALGLQEALPLSTLFSGTRYDTMRGVTRSGTESTIYAQRGPMVFRVSAMEPIGADNQATLLALDAMANRAMAPIVAYAEAGMPDA
jgi:hypothetical protein